MKVYISGAQWETFVIYNASVDENFIYSAILRLIMDIILVGNLNDIEGNWGCKQSIITDKTITKKKRTNEV